MSSGIQTIGQGNQEHPSVIDKNAHSPSYEQRSVYRVEHAGLWNVLASRWARWWQKRWSSGACVWHCL